ncbi:MAG: hypothetical protein ACK56F_05685, partial [bacterium]
LPILLAENEDIFYSLIFVKDRIAFLVSLTCTKEWTLDTEHWTLDSGHWTGLPSVLLVTVSL